MSLRPLCWVSTHSVRCGVKELTQRLYYQRPGWRDGTSQFAAMIRKRLESSSRLLDLGAGRGKTGPVGFRGQVATIVGVDPDTSIAGNVTVDYRVRGCGETLPFRAAAFDLVFSDWVMEHLADPSTAVAEVFRVLKPGGFFVFRTGNLFHYSYAIAAATPHWFHRLIANRVRALSNADDHLDQTYYRINTLSAVRRGLARAGFIVEEISLVEAEPSYLMFSVPSFLLGLAYERLVNHLAWLARLRACIFVCARKPV
jgi:SAM-dependent methyltransferase